MQLAIHRGPADAERFPGLRVVAARLLRHCVADRGVFQLAQGDAGRGAGGRFAGAVCERMQSQR
jgi:hypothetical protein